MSFNPGRLIDRLASFPLLLDRLGDGFEGEEWRWRPEPGVWAPVEIVAHLLREEREDFRARLFMTLDSPGEAWPGIDPEGAVRQNRDIDADPAALLHDFSVERAASVARLRSLDSPGWDAAYTHPVIGSIRAGDLLAAWADHDALHARQLVKRAHQLTLSEAGPYSCRYAGEWTA